MATMPTLPEMYTDALIASVQAKIDSSSRTGESVNALNKILKELGEHGLAEFGVQLDCETVGVSPKNRSGIGVDAFGSQEHGDEVLKVGYCRKKAADATCVNRPPPPHGKELIECNIQLEQQAKGSIPPLKTLKAVSVGGSHTNTFCRQVKGEVKCLLDEPVAIEPDENGNLSYAKLTAGRPDFKDAVDNGMNWTVLHWGVPFAWPKLLDLIQEALNVVCASRQGEIEIMLKVAKIIAAAEAAGYEVGYKRVAGQAAHGNPPCKLYVKNIVDYVKKYSGGTNYPLIVELKNHKQTFGVASGQQQRILGGEFIGRAANLTFGKLENFPYMVNAALKANICCNRNKIKDGHCRLLKPECLTQLTSKDNRENVVQAEKLLADSRQLLDLNGIAAGSARGIELLGRLDVRCVLHILKKGTELDAKTFESIVKISEACTHVIFFVLADAVASLYTV